jgi:Uma2 family endonuclease
MSTALMDPPVIDSSEDRFEVVNGVRVELMPMGAFAVTIAFELARILANFAMSRRLGLVCTEALFKIQENPRQERRPDLSFVSRQRMRGELPPSLGAWDVIPDLAVEVVSPTNTATEIDGKVTEYIDAGVRQVWVLHPESRRLYIHRSRRDVAVFNPEDPIREEELFAGLQFKLADIYAAVDALVE